MLEYFFFSSQMKVGDTRGNGFSCGSSYKHDLDIDCTRKLQLKTFVEKGCKGDAAVQCKVYFICAK